MEIERNIPISINPASGPPTLLTEPRETVAFIRSSKRDPDTNPLLIPSLVIVNTAGLVLILTVHALAQFLRFSAAAGWLKGLIEIAVVLITLRILVRGYYSPKTSKALPSPDAPDSANDARIRCVGRPTDLGEDSLRDDRFFEPVIMHYPLGRRPKGAMNVFAGLILLACVGAAFGVRHMLSGLFRGGDAADFVYAGMFIGSVVVYFLWPTYLRIVPGRLDVLQFFAFRSTPIERRSYDLKAAKILVDLPRRVAFIDGPPDSKLELPLWPRKSGRKLAYYLLLAAISTHQPGPLPDDELLG